MHEVVVAVFGIAVGLIPFFADKAEIPIPKETAWLGLAITLVVIMACAIGWSEI